MPARKAKSSAPRKTKTAKPALKVVKAAPKKTVSADELQMRKILASHIAERDRTQFVDQDLQAMASAFFNFIEVRKPGNPKIRVFNPTAKADGYISRHTVIMVANDDMSFLVDSTSTELNRLGVGVHLIVHPMVDVTRDSKGNFTGYAGKKSKNDDAITESWMYIEIDETRDEARLKEIANQLTTVLHQVRLAVDDWRAMRAKVLDTLTELPGNEQAGLPAGEREEVAELLAWLEADNFTFLGVRDYVVEGTGKNKHLEVAKHSGLGILRDPLSVMFNTHEGEGAQPSDIHLFLERKQLAIVTKAYRQSLVHRRAPMDAILVKRYDENGKVVGERLFIGLFTSASYSRMPRDVPLIRERIAYVTHKAGLDPRSHNGKALAHILTTYPRDELFQISGEELYDAAMGILDLQERQRLALFVRHDAFSRFVSCLIFMPREQFDSKLRREFESILSRTFHGSATAYNVLITEAALAQIFIMVQIKEGKIPSYNKAALEKELHEAARGWQGRLQDELVAAFGESHGLAITTRYRDAFTDAYCDSVIPKDTLIDIAFVEEVLKTGKLAVHLYQDAGANATQLSVVWYNAGAPLPLSHILPMMEHMGLAAKSEEGPFEIRPAGADKGVWVHDCHAYVQSGFSNFKLADVKDKFEDCLTRMWTGEVEADGYNSLVLLADLNWREVVILRMIGKYLRQARLPYSEATIQATLAAHPDVARQLVELFISRHDPAAKKDSAKACARIEKQIVEYLRGVKLLDHDRVLRRYLNVIQNTLRTNYFQKAADGSVKEYVSIKLNSKALDDLPLPRPMVEIFVYSPKVEGIHLRMGKVARGGLRWSDRREDFRTEILGLMKAQNVKNTVIVPVGSKGGFVVKTPNPPDMAKEGVACYQTYIKALLDITDNRKGEKIVPPKDVVRHDADDPYLVVAADKGTAKFSDIANAISLEYGFWLGDAFASGGSVGYDHKEMGITARGAWEAVKRHFREMGKDIQKEDFTVVGVGDMAGDVFGNGMLLSEHIRLLGAFNHKHIFIDPSPDAAKSYKERKRLFDMPGSQWTDYDKKLLSKGGGVYERSGKTVALSKEARDMLGLPAGDVSPDAVMRAMLLKDAELLWFGGIGTYVKAEEEGHADVGDRANDTLRVNGGEIRARVIGEGANLGLTQKGRIEFAQNGGRLNTDAIDNSAGVDTSDHEVNIKILLSLPIQDGKLTLKSRNTVLAKMTNDVARLVLRDNYLQTMALSIAESRAAELLPLHTNMMHQLERIGLLNRKVEFLPSDDEIQERLRANKGLTRPELAVLMGYAKLALYDEILASNLPDNPALEGDLFLYFPKAMQTDYAEYVKKHRLRREIIATFTTNSLVNRAGLHFAIAMKERTGRSAADITSAYAITRDVYSLRDMWHGIESLDGKVPAKIQIDIFNRLGNLIEKGTEWYLGNVKLEDTAEVTDTHRAAVATVRAWLEKNYTRLFHGTGTMEKWQEYKDAGVPDDLVKNVLFLPLLALVPEIIKIAGDTKQKLEQVAEIYFGIEERFHLQWLRREAMQLPVENHWQREAIGHLIDDFYGVQAGLARQAILASGNAKKPAGAAECIRSWLEGKKINMAPYDHLIADMAGSTRIHSEQIALALRQLQPWAAGKN